MEKRPFIVSFDLSNMGDLTVATKMQLRVFKRRSKRRNLREFYYINLYEFQNNVKHNASRENKRLISSRFVRNARGEWLSFDVLSVLKLTDKSLKITKPSFLIDVIAVKSRPKSKPLSIALKSGRKQPFILVFYEKSPKALPASEIESSIGVEKSLEKFPFLKTRFSRSVDSFARPNNLCSRHTPLHINFRRFGITSVVAPLTYNAHYCTGRCPVFSNDQSLYSFFRNRQRLEVGNSVPAACCVPIKLEPLRVLYIGTKNRIHLKMVADMVVSSCGCR